MATNGSHGHFSGSWTNYCAFIHPGSGVERIGHLDLAQGTIQPLSFASGTPLSNLYEVIAVDETGIIASGEQLQRSAVKLLAPINGRDILCVGKNYRYNYLEALLEDPGTYRIKANETYSLTPADQMRSAHATEFNKSGYDSSDKVDQPTHPVIFTKRFTSIIADGDEIYPHSDFTGTLDYEGEFGVIIGKPGFQISEADALDHVWGYVIINDVTAREKQRDHKQFYLGKSADTFCPMGPIAVPKERLEKTFRVQTRVNGQPRQDATTEDLIFSVPYLIKTLSEGQTLMPGDVLATGTPAGVGFGQDPPVYLKPGDEVTISVTGLGQLTNRIAAHASSNPILQEVKSRSAIKASNSFKSLNAGVGLTNINGKPTYVRHIGKSDGPPIVFVHGLGGTHDFWTPLIASASLASTHALHLFDLEGHGLTPTSPLSKLSLASLSEDISHLFTSSNIAPGATLVAHSLGCLIAMKFVIDNPGRVGKLVLVGPPPSPLPEAGSRGSHARAALVRAKGMTAVVDAVATAGTSAKTQSENPVAVAAVRMSLLGQDPEGYAKGCTALAEATQELNIAAIDAKTLIVTGEEDKVSPPTLCEGYVKKLGSNSAGLKVLPGVGHWHVFEDVKGVAEAVKGFL